MKKKRMSQKEAAGWRRIALKSIANCEEALDMLEKYIPRGGRAAGIAAYRAGCREIAEVFAPPKKSRGE